MSMAGIIDMPTQCEARSS